MRTVNVAELKNRLSKFLSFAKGGEEVVIRDRNLPVAKLVPFLAKVPMIRNLVWLRPGNCVSPRCDPM
jgi:prevent-host-death family protein